jgi:acetolactate synthase-1/3 small subunit
MSISMSGSILAQLQQRHTVTVLVENHAGVLARVAGLFARRGFNIESLAVSVTDKPEVSRMTIVVGGDHRVLEQITKQLNKLVEVIKVVDYTETAAVERELALIKVNAEAKDRAEIMQIVEIFRGRIIDMSEKTFIIEVTGSTDKLDKITDLLTGYGIRELVRTGVIAMARGSKTASRAGRDAVD